MGLRAKLAATLFGDDMVSMAEARDLIARVLERIIDLLPPEQRAVALGEAERLIA